MVQGETFEVTLTFENAGDITVTVPVDLERMPEHGDMGRGDMDHGDMKMDTGEVDHSKMNH